MRPYQFKCKKNLTRTLTHTILGQGSVKSGTNHIGVAKTIKTWEEKHVALGRKHRQWDHGRTKNK